MTGCSHKQSKVTDSRKDVEGQHRRRECLKCKHRWTTIEIEVLDSSRPSMSMNKLEDRLRRKIYGELAESFKTLGE